MGVTSVINLSLIYVNLSDNSIQGTTSGSLQHTKMEQPQGEEVMKFKAKHETRSPVSKPFVLSTY